LRHRLAFGGPERVAADMSGRNRRLAACRQARALIEASPIVALMPPLLFFIPNSDKCGSLGIWAVCA
jgi:hypothetical protein